MLRHRPPGKPPSITELRPQRGPSFRSAEHRHGTAEDGSPVVVSGFHETPLEPGFMVAAGDRDYVVQADGSLRRAGRFRGSKKARRGERKRLRAEISTTAEAIRRGEELLAQAELQAAELAAAASGAAP